MWEGRKGMGGGGKEREEREKDFDILQIP